MFTKFVRKLVKFSIYGMGHCYDGGGYGGGPGHCY